VTNKAFFVGNVGGDPELRYTQKGSAVVEFSLAIQKGYKDESGNWQEKDPVWLTVKAWQGLAENVAETVTTGMRVVVIGKLDVETWEAEDGGKRSKVVIVADEVSPSLRWATASVTKQAKAAS
jgi:single-strand DNA-binding protein